RSKSRTAPPTRYASCSDARSFPWTSRTSAGILALSTARSTPEIIVDRRSGTARIGVLDAFELGGRKRQRIAAMAGLAEQIPLRHRLVVAVEAIAAECVGDVGGAALADRGARRRGREREELPIMRRRVEAVATLDRRLVGDELNHG